MARARIVKKWILVTSIGLIAACICVSAGLFAFSGSLVPPAAAPLQLSPLSPAANTAAPDGTWIAGEGSLAGFRVPESFLMQSGTIVGRTSAVTGSLSIAHNEIASGSFQVDLSKVTIGGKANASFFTMLDTSQYPDATLTLTQPIVFSSIPANGQTISSKATASLSMHGITRTLTFTITARYNGSVLEATGTAASPASDWSIKSPFGIQNDGMIEFLAMLHRA